VKSVEKSDFYVLTVISVNMSKDPLLASKGIEQAAPIGTDLLQISFIKTDVNYS
jgi:hypothetical protein